VAGYGQTAITSSTPAETPDLNFLGLENFDLETALNDPEILSEFRASLISLRTYIQVDRILCFKASPDRSPYFGDSGGPIYQLDKNGNYFLVGVESHGLQKTQDSISIIGACGPTIQFHRQWIDSI
jgi:hypothetical protein